MASGTELNSPIVTLRWIDGSLTSVAD